MKRNKFTVGYRNKLANLAADCDCAPAVESMTPAERSALQQKMRDVLYWVDERIKV